MFSAAPLSLPRPGAGPPVRLLRLVILVLLSLALPAFPSTPGWALEGEATGVGTVRVLVTFAGAMTGQEQERSIGDLAPGQLRRIGHRVAVLPVAGAAVAGVLRQLSRRPGVVAAEIDQQLRISVAPDDPGFSSQWALRNTGHVVAGEAGLPGADIYADAA